MSQTTLGIALVLAAVTGATAAPPPDKDPDRQTITFTETFSQDMNEGAWRFGIYDLVSDLGGNPGPYLRNPYLDTFAPQPRTEMGIASAFTGDYRATQVVSVGVDLKTFSVGYSADQRPLSVLLTSDPGTPDDSSDDCTVYLMGDVNVPTSNGRDWRSYDFDVPNDATTLPQGWSVLRGCAESDPDAAWNRVIGDVDQLRYFYGDPELFFIFQTWDVGLDNATITRKLQ